MTRQVPDPTEEAALVSRLVARDPAAMADVYDHYAALVYTTALRVVRHTQTAEDLTQETFLRVWNRIAAFDEHRGNLTAWIVTIARNQAIDFTRSAAMRKARATQGIEQLRVSQRRHVLSPGFEDSILLSDWAKTFRSALARLPLNQRRVLNLSIVAGMTHLEIAKAIGRPLGTVKTWMRSALQILRAHSGAATWH